MKLATAAATAVSIALAAAPALAGVVITQEQSQNYPQRKHTVEQTVMVQGNKEKVVSPHNELIVDLGKGLMYVVDLPAKTYLELPYPPRNALAKSLEHNSGLKFKKLGKTRKIAGYPCEEYVGTGKTAFSEFTVSECVAKNAPGAAEFASFKKLEASSLQVSGSQPSGDIPVGIPLSSVRVTKSTMPVSNLSSLSAQQRERIEKMIAQRNSTTVSTLVSKIEVKKLAASTFEIPAGFTKREFPVRTSLPIMAPHPLPPVKK